MVGAVHMGVGARRFVIALIAVAVCAAIVWFGRGLMPAASPPAHTGPAANLVWSDRVPLSKAMMTQWLRERGVKYATWAKRHPAAAAKLADQ